MTITMTVRQQSAVKMGMRIDSRLANTEARYSCGTYCDSLSVSPCDTKLKKVVGSRANSSAMPAVSPKLT